MPPYNNWFASLATPMICTLKLPVLQTPPLFLTILTPGYTTLYKRRRLSSHNLAGNDNPERTELTSQSNNKSNGASNRRPSDTLLASYSAITDVQQYCSVVYGLISRLSFISLFTQFHPIIICALSFGK